MRIDSIKYPKINSYKPLAFSNQKGRIGAIYLIDKEGNGKRFQDIKTAAEFLNISSISVRNHLQSQTMINNKYIPMKATEIEQRDNEGRITLNQDKIKGIRRNFYSVKSAQALYAISKNGEYERFNSQSEAANKLNMSQLTVSAGLKGEVKNPRGYRFVNADEIEYFDENNIPKVNEEKLGQIVRSMNKENDDYFYGIDKEGNVTRYQSYEEAYKKTGEITTSIYKALRGKYFSLDGNVFMYPFNMETKDEFGNVKIDTQKAKRLISPLESTREGILDKKLYAIDSQGTLSEINGAKEAQKMFGIGSKLFSKCALGKSLRVNYSILTAAENIEKRDENGNITYDEEKIKRIAKEAGNKRVKSVYAIKESGYKRYDSLDEAYKDTNIEKSEITKSARTRTKAGEYHFVYASEIEKEDENGDIIVDIESVKFNDGKKPKATPVYAITDSKKYKKFKSIKEAERATKVSAAKITLITQKKADKENNFTFVLAQDAEQTDENGETKINKKALLKAYNEAFGQNQPQN